MTTQLILIKTNARQVRVALLFYRTQHHDESMTFLCQPTARLVLAPANTQLIRSVRIWTRLRARPHTETFVKRHYSSPQYRGRNRPCFRHRSTSPRLQRHDNDLAICQWTVDTTRNRHIPRGWPNIAEQVCAFGSNGAYTALVSCS